jgi:hypothetical protein
MSKTLRTAAMIVGAVALVATGVGAVVGATAAAAAGSAGIGSLSIATVASVASASAAALSVGASVTAKQPSQTGSPTTFDASGQGGIPYAMGRTGNAGQLVYWREHGSPGKDPNDRETMVVVLSGAGPIDGFESFSADQTSVTFDGSGNAVGYFRDYMWQARQLGRTPELTRLLVQSGNASLPPGWTDLHKLSGYAAAMWTLRFDAKKQKYYQNGTPKPVWVIRGVKVYDPRRDSTYPGGSGPCRALDESTYVYSENPYLHGLTWCLGRWQNGKRVMGLGAPLMGLDVAAYVEGANIADFHGWKVGGVAYSTDNKWDTLVNILQAGMGEPLALGARISCFVNAPKVSLDRVTVGDLSGEATVQATRSRRDRINTVVPKYRSESHNWEQVTAAPVTATEYLGIDGGKRSKEIPYTFIQDLKQAAVAARYDIENAREFGPITLPLRPRWVGYKPGDCVTVHLPEVGLTEQKVLLTQRDIDPTSGLPVMTARSETDGKHPYALGQTTVAPPTPGVVGPPLVPVPGDGAWAITGTQIESGEATVPALVIAGQVDAATAEAVLFEFRAFVSGQDASTGWIAAGTETPLTLLKIITAVQSETAYEVAVSYRAGGVLGERRILGPVTTGAASIEWGAGVVGPNKPQDNATNSGDPDSPFGPGTVREAIATLDRIEPIGAAVDLLDKATADSAAAQRQMERDTARLADTLLRLTSEAGRTRDVLRDAGITVDPATGAVRIYAIDQLAERTSKAEVALDGVNAKIGLKASVDYVNEKILAAQLDPSQIEGLDELISRVTSAEVDIDGLNAAVALRASLEQLTGVSGRVTTVESDLNALEGTVSLKAESTTVDQLATNLGSVQQTLQSLGNVSGVTVTIRQARAVADDGAEAALRALLAGDGAAKRTLAAQAQIRQELYTKINDDLSAEAAARTLLNVRVGQVDSRLSTELLVQASNISGLSRSITALQVTIGQNAAAVTALQSAVVNGDLANAQSIQQVTARLDGVGQVGIEQAFDAVVNRVGKIEGTYTVKVDTNGNVVGFQLIGSETGAGSLNLINTDLRMGTGRVIFNNGSVMRVQGTGFGANGDLITWFGPTMAIAQCSRANAISYEATNGDAYFGGSLSAGVIKNAVQTTSTAPNAAVQTGPLASNGRPRTVVISYTWTREATSSAGSAAMGALFAQVKLYRGSTEIGTLNATGEWTRTAYGGVSSPSRYSEAMSGSLTIGDTSGGSTVEYSAVLITRSLGPGPSGTIQQDAIGQNISIIQTEE